MIPYSSDDVHQYLAMVLRHIQQETQETRADGLFADQWRLAVKAARRIDSDATDRALETLKKSHRLPDNS